MNDPSVVMNLVYIDDVVNELINALKEMKIKYLFWKFLYTYHYSWRIVDLIYSFKKSREDSSAKHG